MTKDVGHKWDGQGWNDGGTDKLLIGIERDQDTDGWDEWCWRVGVNGEVVAHGREETHLRALGAATAAAKTSEWWFKERQESP